MAKNSDKPYIRVEKVLSKEVTYQIPLKKLRAAVVQLLLDNVFKIRFENSPKQGPHKKVSLVLSLGDDPLAKEVRSIVALSTDLGGEDIAKLIGSAEIAQACQDSDVVCGDKNIRITKRVSEE